MTHSLIEIKVGKSEELFVEVAKQIGAFLASLEQNPDIVIALPGGRSVVKLLSAFLPMLRGISPDVRSKLQFFMVDERVVELSSDDSNFKMLNQLFYNVAILEGLITEAQLHPFRISSEPVEKTVRDYFEELTMFGSRFDLSVLGVGEDAHVAGLFPNHHSIKNPTNQFFTFNDSPKPPPYRLTASRKLIETSRMAVALFVGEAKRDALSLFRKEEAIELCPASIIRNVPQAIVATDIPN